MLEGSAAPPRRTGVRRFAVPSATLVALLVSWWIGLLWPMIPISAFLAFYLFALPKLVRAREVRFQKEALRLLATGRGAEVPALARRQLALQLFGSSGPVDALLGIAYAQGERWVSAAAHLEPAVAAATGPDSAALRASLAKALFAIGDLDRAEDEGTRLLETGLRLPETLVIVARARQGLGRGIDRAGALLDEAAALAPSADVATMIALTRVESQLAADGVVDALADDLDSGQRFVRAWIHFVRGRLRERRGDPAGAAASYAKAEREAGEEIPVFGALAHQRLGALAASRVSR
jgi:tetratricopeptide (TPR) repeat protein